MRTVLYGSLLILVGLYAIGVSVGISREQPIGLDFMPLWAASRVAFENPSRLYDFQYITLAQPAVNAIAGTIRPYIYPPSALLAFAPFSVMQFGWANMAWSVGTGLLLVLVTLRTVPRRKLLALCGLTLTPAFGLVAVTGQTTFLVASLLTAGLFHLQRRPALAGVLIGIAAAIKPNTLVLAPFCMMIGGHWRAVLASFVSGAAMGMGALLLFGIDTWMTWLSTIGDFQDYVLSRDGFLRNMITPTSAAISANRPEYSALIHWVFAALGTLFALWTFRVTGDWRFRLIALVIGSVWIGGYAMSYDAALLAPAVAALLAATENRSWPFGLALFMLFVMVTETYAGPYVVVAIGVLSVVAVCSNWAGQACASEHGDEPLAAA